MSDKKKYYNLWEKVKETINPIHENEEEFESLLSKISTKKDNKKSNAKHKETNIKTYITPIDTKEFETKSKTTKQIFDKNIYSKIVKEKIKIQSRIDLHGLSQEQAFSRVRSFIINSYAQNHKVSLIITGKGKGILRNSLSAWLHHEDICDMILFHKIAADKHGGSGAYYVYYKKLR